MWDQVQLGREIGKDMRPFIAGLILMSHLCSSPPHNPPARHPAPGERIIQKLFSQATFKAVPPGRNSEAPPAAPAWARIS